MYRRNRYGSNQIYMAIFWLVVGVLIGQFFRFNIQIEDSRSSVNPTEISNNA